MQNGSRNVQIGPNSTRHSSHPPVSLFIDPEISRQKTEIINLFLNLSDPLTGAYTPQFEKLGFFFAGILPGGFKDGDALMLQYLNNVPIDYAAIQVKSAMAKKLLAYVKEQDPNL